MAFAIIRSVRAAANTSSGNQDFTVAGIGTPKAAQIIVTSATSSSGASANDRRISFGVTDGTFQGGSGGTDQDAVSTTVATRAAFDDAVVRLPNPAGTTFEAVATFVNFIADGIRINWTTAPPSAYIVHVVLWAGDDVQVKCGSVVPDVLGGAAVYTNVGFEPQHLIVSSSLDASLDETLRSDLHLQVSHTINLAGVPTTHALATTHRNGFSSAAPAVLRDDQLAQTIRARNSPFLLSTATALDSVTPFDSTGFNVISATVAGTGPRIVYMALSYGSKQYALKVETAPNATGSASFTGYGFRPGFAISIPTLCTSNWGANVEADDFQAGSYGYAHWSGPEQWCVNLLCEDVVATTNTNSRTQSKPVSLKYMDDASMYSEANWVGFTADGFDLDYTTIDASLGFRFLVFALETEIVSGTSAGILPLVAGAGASALVFQGTSAGILPLVAGAGTASLRFQGTSAGILPLVAGAGASALVFQGTSAGILPLVIAAGNGPAGDALACQTLLQGSHQITATVLGDYVVAKQLQGSHQITATVLGDYVVAKQLQGTYKTVNDFLGDVC